MDCFLTLRGIKTLAVRMERHQANAAILAKDLEMNQHVTWVRYPGLKSHPQQALAMKQMSGFAGMISFELKGGLGSGAEICDRSTSVCAGGVARRS